MIVSGGCPRVPAPVRAARSSACEAPRRAPARSVRPATRGGLAATRGGLAARLRGVAMLETLLAAPIVLLIGLSVLQWALVFHGHGAVLRAATEAARAGSVDHASPDAIERGLVRGLAPWYAGATGPEDYAEGLERTRAHLAFGKAAGWVQWRQLAPTAASFDDWAEPARDAQGRVVAGLREIPNDNLTMRSSSTAPASGTAGYRGSEPIGRASGQTLADANLLKLELSYGVPVTVPVVGRVAAWVMRAIDGCGAAASKRLGALSLGVPPPQARRLWACAYYDAVDESGARRPRWPVRVSATIRMQSPARSAADSGTATAAPLAGAALGPGEVDDPSAFAPVPIGQVNPSGATPGSDGSVDRGEGFLRIGAPRLVELPLACAAP